MCKLQVDQFLDVLISHHFSNAYIVSSFFSFDVDAYFYNANTIYYWLNLLETTKS